MFFSLYMRYLLHHSEAKIYENSYKKSTNHFAERRVCEIGHHRSIYPHQAISLAHRCLFSCTSCHWVHYKVTFLSYGAETGAASE